MAIAQEPGIEAMHAEHAWNTRLVGHTDMNGHGDACQIMITADHRHAFVAHMHSMGFSVIDITERSQPRVIKQIENPPDTHSHKCQLVGDVLVVNQEELHGGPPTEHAGVDIYDVSDPAKPRRMSHFPVKGRGVHRMWCTDGKYLHLAATEEGYWEYIYRIIDIADPVKPREAGRWWLPGQWTAGGEQLGWEPSEKNFMHSAIVPHGDRAYVSYRDGGILLLDISDLSNIKLLSCLNWRPPYGGSTHTFLPLEGRGVALVSDEAVRNNCEEGQKLAWVVDIRAETNPVVIGTFPVPKGDFCAKGSRFGPHNFHEYRPGSQQDTSLAYLTYFNAGVRIYDTSDAYHPVEVGFYIPERPDGAPVIQTNDVHVDADGLIYLADRLKGGLHIVEYTGPRPSLS